MDCHSNLYLFFGRSVANSISYFVVFVHNNANFRKFG